MGQGAVFSQLSNPSSVWPWINPCPLSTSSSFAIIWTTPSSCRRCSVLHCWSLCFEFITPYKTNIWCPSTDRDWDDQYHILKHLEPWHKVRSIQNHQHKVRRFSNCNRQSMRTFAFSNPLHNTRKMIKRLDLGIIVVDDARNASEWWIHTELILIVFLSALSKADCPRFGKPYWDHTSMHKFCDPSNPSLPTPPLQILVIDS